MAQLCLTDGKCCSPSTAKHSDLLIAEPPKCWGEGEGVGGGKGQGAEIEGGKVQLVF